MTFRSRWIVGFYFLFSVCFAVPIQAQSYDSELKLGVDAYKNNQYEEAMGHFRKATEIDPSQTTGHLYLATTLVSQYIPGVNSPDNLRSAEEAIEQYQLVIDSAADVQAKINSVKGIAYLYLNMKKWDDAKTYYQKASGLDPNDPEPYYSVGVIDWTRCYQPRMEERAKLGVPPDEHLNASRPEQKKICDELQAKNSALVEEGIGSLDSAIHLRPDYDDAMAYMNLMYRERADLECEDSVARSKDLRTADEWVDRTLATKKAKAERGNLAK